jgi:hypothetical protein
MKPRITNNLIKNCFPKFISEANQPPRPGDPNHPFLKLVRPLDTSGPEDKPPVEIDISGNRPSWWPSDVPWPPPDLTDLELGSIYLFDDDLNLGSFNTPFSFYSNVTPNGFGLLWTYNEITGQWSAEGPLPVLGHPGQNLAVSGQLFMPQGSVLYYDTSQFGSTSAYMHILTPSGELWSYLPGNPGTWSRITDPAIAQDIIQTISQHTPGMFDQPAYVFTDISRPLQFDKNGLPRFLDMRLNFSNYTPRPPRGPRPPRPRLGA